MNVLSLGATVCALVLLLCHAVTSETIIWQDEFDTLDLSKWNHLVSAWSGGNAEFQMYRNDRKNSYVRDGFLYLKPTLTADEYGEDLLYNGSLSYPDCNKEPCVSSSGADIVEPILSARMISTFGFKYGRVEIKAQMPKGHWLWPAIWMLPKDNVYGDWPRSGEVDIIETRGNENYFDQSGVNQGIDRMGSTMHWGPDYLHNWYWKTHWEQSLAGTGRTYADDFHLYGVEWTDQYMRFTLDYVEYGRIDAPADGFWYFGEYDKNPGGDNIWQNGNNMAPFDQEFTFIFNVAIGGYFFPDEWDPHPWSWFSGHTMRDFWEGRSEWLPTWNGEQAAMKVDYIRVFSLD
ncbi:beta-1,3-glucan-binding protein-like [Periplaneta americana]|uniref:beta-1,3-glucan-binding protein-like n=1 Tax=Periplaneta americana TaxID=6978 RepID=UPI0037E91121